MSEKKGMRERGGKKAGENKRDGGRLEIWRKRLRDVESKSK